jgi:hypothetical protein
MKKNHKSTTVNTNFLHFLFPVMLSMLVLDMNAQIAPSALKDVPTWGGNPSVENSIEGFTGVGINSWGTNNKNCLGKSTTHRVKINKGAGNYLQFPQLTDLGKLEVIIQRGSEDGLYELILEKQNGLSWEEIGKQSYTITNSDCFMMTFGENEGISQSNVTVRLRNINSNGGSGSIWLRNLTATGFSEPGDNGNGDNTPGYTFTNDMPESGLGPIPLPLNPTPWHSELLDVSAEGALVYHPDADGFVIPDFSNAGYKNGEEPIPDVSVIKEIEPVSGDNTQHIRNAINEMASFPLNEDGIRGALLLKKGLYPVVGPIYLDVEGVVLRGEGNTGDPSVSTVIYDTCKDLSAASGRAVLVLGHKSNDGWDMGKNNETNIIDNIVPAGSYKVHIAKNENYRAGDPVCIYHPCSEAWLQAVEYGQTYTPGGQPEGAWTTSSAPIYYHRYVKNVAHEGTVTEITLDAPVFYTLNRSLSQCTIYRFNRKALQNIGIENLRVDIVNEGILIQGILPGEMLSVYNMQGRLVYHNGTNATRSRDAARHVSTTTEQRVPLHVRGVYIVVSGEQRMKAVY